MVLLEFEMKFPHKTGEGPGYSAFAGTAGPRHL